MLSSNSNHLFDDTVVNQSAELLCGGSTYEHRSIITTACGLSERLQELRVEILQVYIKIFSPTVCADEKVNRGFMEYISN